MSRRRVVREKIMAPLPSGAAVREFLHNESLGGIALVIAAAVAVLWANLGDSYFDFWHKSLNLSFGGLHLPSDLHGWINDGLMVIFFFVVALEIKRELVTGELNSRSKAALPALAAVGGAALPALIFILIVGTGSDAARGWGIPMATDIAFAVGVLALLGKRVPMGAKVLLLSIAIVDDVLAIGVIAVFYTTDLQPLWLFPAVIAYLVMVHMRRAEVMRIAAYVPFGVIIWLAVLQTGIHATIAGVAIGLLTPATPIRGRQILDEIVHRLHPYTSFFVVPLFALANAGIAFSPEVVNDALTHSLAVAIAVALVFGKLIGISSTIALVSKLGIGRLPSGVKAGHVVGVACLGGIGFTVSLFIAQLSFTNPETTDVAKLGIFTGSIAAATIGLMVLLLAGRSRQSKPGQSGPPT